MKYYLHWKSYPTELGKVNEATNSFRRVEKATLHADCLVLLTESIEFKGVKTKYTSRLLSRKPRVGFRPTNVIASLASVFQLPDEPVFKHLILQTGFPSGGFQGPVSFSTWVVLGAQNTSVI